MSESVESAVMDWFRLIIVMLYCALLVACSAEDEGTFVDQGRIVDGVYINEQFRFRVPIPRTWSVGSTAAKQGTVEDGARQLGVLRSRLEASKKTSSFLLLLSKFDARSTIGFNPSVSVVAQRPPRNARDWSVSDYLSHVTKTYASSDFGYARPGAPYPTQIGGGKWWRSDLTKRNSEATVRQAVMVTRRGEHFLSILLSADSAEGLAELEQIISRATFDR